MKKFFSLFAAVLMAGSMMAEAGWIKFSAVQPSAEVAGSTYGSNEFTLDIPATSDKASVDANNCTFGFSAEETVSFTHRLKTGGASSKDGRKFTLNIPEEGPLTIYARTSSKDATNRSFLIANDSGSDTIAYHVCLDTDTVEGTSSKIFLPVFVENVPAGSYKITYNDGINFYGFQLGLEESTGWDGTVTQSKDTITSLADLEGITLTFNGAATLALLDAEGSMIVLQNEDGSEMYAVWSPAYGGTYTINGAVVTLGGWYAAEGETDPLPAESATLYVEDYGSFIVDGDDEAYFETAEIAYEVAPATTYTVNFSVVGHVEEETSAIGSWVSPDYEKTGMLVAGNNTVEEGNFVQVLVQYIEGYSAEVKVNNEVVTLVPMGLNLGWRDLITADMTIVVTFTGPTTGVENVKAVKATKALVGGKVMIIRNGVRYNVAGLKF